jgi:uncharacterized lipoprotein YddW (UPF0748 family)
MKLVSLLLLSLFLIISVKFTASGQSSGFQVRALWVDQSGVETKEAIDQMISTCQSAGINAIIPYVMAHGSVYFKSVHYQGRVAANDQFDPLDYLIKKAHAASIKVQAWSYCYYESAGKARRPELLSQSFDRNAQAQNFLSPANPEVNPYILSVLKDILAYDVDGIHLDYIRYCNAAFDYSDNARKGCQAELGFDPLNFLDHPEQIVPADKDPFPIRVLHPKTQLDKVWEIGAVERNLNRTGVGFAFVSETSQNIEALRTPGLLIISHYSEVSPEMASSLSRYVERGGNILWIEPAGSTLQKYPEIQKLTGLKGVTSFPKTRVSLKKSGDHPMSNFIPDHSFYTSGCIPQTSKASVIAQTSSGEPIITINQIGRDARRASVMVIGFRAMENNDDAVIELLKRTMNWYRAGSSVKGPDLLAEKREQWVKWRADQVVKLVRQVNEAAKAKNPKIEVTSSAGVGPQQYYGCYRDGGYWLTEKINDVLFPMDYTTDPVELKDILEEQISRTPKGMSDKIFPGLQIYTRDANKKVTSLNAEIVRKQLELVREKGYKGYCLFAYHYLSDDIIEVLKGFN